LQYTLHNDGETTQTTTEQNSDCSSKKGGETDGFDILPRDEMPKEVRRNCPGRKTEQATEQHAGKRASGHYDEDVFPSHNPRCE